jgi:transcriptional regulator GlxA family with amidase domain
MNSCGTENERVVVQQTVGILIFPEVEVLDFCGPLEVFSVARVNEERRSDEPSPFRAVLIAETLDPITTASGMRVLPEFTLENHPDLDILLIPGGIGTRPLQTHKRLLVWIALCAQQVKILASVCTGSFLLAAAGQLEGRAATTHWQSLDRMREHYANVRVRDDLQVVEDGKVFTSAGIAAGIDLALRIVALTQSMQTARNAARYMEYPYPENNQRRVEARLSASRS